MSLFRVAWIHGEWKFTEIRYNLWLGMFGNDDGEINLQIHL